MATTPSAHRAAEVLEGTGRHAARATALCRMDESRTYLIHPTSAVAQAWEDAGYCLDRPAWAPTGELVARHPALRRLHSDPAALVTAHYIG